MRISLGQLLIRVACIGIVFALIGKYYYVSHWAPGQVESVLAGESLQEISSFSITRYPDTITVSDRRGCEYLTKRFRKSIPLDGTSYHGSLGRRAVFCGNVTVTLANGASVEGHAKLGETGIVLSLPPNNKFGWDLRDTHYVSWDDSMPTNLAGMLEGLLQK